MHVKFRLCFYAIGLLTFIFKLSWCSQYITFGPHDDVFSWTEHPLRLIRCQQIVPKWMCLAWPFWTATLLLIHETWGI